MKLKKITADDLSLMKAGDAQVFEYGNYVEYDSAKSLCYKYGKRLNKLFSCTDNKDHTYTVICKERKGQ